MMTPTTTIAVATAVSIVFTAIAAWIAFGGDQR